MGKRQGLTWDDINSFEVDEEDGHLYWNGQAVVLEKRVKLKRYQIWLAILATIGTLLSGVYPFLDHWHLLG